jgi:hypothetical protein
MPHPAEPHPADSQPAESRPADSQPADHRSDTESARRADGLGARWTWPGPVDDLVAARRALHAVAELVLAGPQWHCSGTIRLAVTADGLRTLAPVEPNGTLLTLTAAGVGPEPGGVRVPLAGTAAEIAVALGLRATPLSALYQDGADLGPHDPLHAPPAAVGALLAALAAGDAALRALAGPNTQPVAWPEHFDVATQLDQVTYGLSPGDAGHPIPYAYVSPWQRRSGPFWNESFGASRPLPDLAVPDGIVAFLSEGRHRTLIDPPQ